METYNLSTGDLKADVHSRRVWFVAKPGAGVMDIYNNLMVTLKSIGVRSYRISFNQGRMADDERVQLQLYRFQDVKLFHKIGQA